MPDTMKKTILLILLFTCVMVSAMPVRAEYPEWQPPKQCLFGMPTLGQAVKAGNTGLITELLREIFEPEGYAVIHIDQPYNRALKALRMGSIHCSLGFKGENPDLPQGTATLAFYDLSVARAADDTYTGVESLTDQEVAHMHGFDVRAMLPVPIKERPAYDLSSAFNMLDRGHVRFVVGDNQLMLEAIFVAKLQPNEFAITKLKTMEVIPVFAPTEEGRTLRSIYDRRMKELITSGKMQQVIKANGQDDRFIERLLKANGY